MKHPLFAMSLLAFLAWSAIAEATDPIAEELFRSARGLMDDGNYGEACPMLEESHRLEPLSGTMLSLGYCREQQGKTATAWAAYREAIRLAKKENRPRYVKSGEAFVAAIEPRLTRLSLQATNPPPGLTVSIGGKPLGSAIGVALPVDPGTLRILVEAPGHQGETLQVDAQGEGKTITVALPRLSPAPTPPPSPPSAPGTGPAPAPSGVPADLLPARGPADEGAEVPVWAWVVGGIGVASLGVATGFLVDQISVARTLDQQCGEQRDQCPPLEEYDFETDFAREERSGGFAIGFGVAGGALLITGVIGIIVGLSDDDAASAQLRVGPRSASLRVSF